MREQDTIHPVLGHPAHTMTIELLTNLSKNDQEALARLLNTRPNMIDDVMEHAEKWPELARQALEKRLSVMTDILSNESLKAIASGKVDLPSVCKGLVQKGA